MKAEESLYDLLSLLIAFTVNNESVHQVLVNQ